MSRRPERLGEQIREELSMIIAGDLDDPRVDPVTVVDTRITPDLRNAKVYVSVMGTDEEAAEALAALRSASGFIRQQLGAVLRLKRVPELLFVHDKTVETAARIEEILSEEVEKARERELAGESSADDATDAASGQSGER
jgi:ribosome-binding factor A